MLFAATGRQVDIEGAEWPTLHQIATAAPESALLHGSAIGQIVAEVGEETAPCHLAERSCLGRRSARSLYRTVPYCDTLRTTTTTDDHSCAASGKIVAVESSRCRTRRHRFCPRLYLE